MKRKALGLTTGVAVLFVAMLGTVSADPGKPNFMPAIYADGQAWGTKGTTTLPAPNAHNRQSFDALYIITNSNNPGSQLPVSEAGPGNPHYNGGRWFAHTVVWTAERLAQGQVPILTSYEDILMHEAAGHLMISAGAPNPNMPVYFQCPLLPVK